MSTANNGNGSGGNTAQTATDAPVAVQVTRAAAGPLPYATPAPKPSAWSPLRIPIFRLMWIAYLVSLIGTWAREYGGPWLMGRLTQDRGDSALWVALVQTAATLPICLLSIAAGVLADIFDRRRLLILTHVWMLLASAALAAVTMAGVVTPGSLLAITLLLGVGAALSGPAFQYVMPELVGPGELPQAIGLNSVALNIARAAGPALGMLMVWTVHKQLHGTEMQGISASFVINAMTFIGVIWVLWTWRPAPKPAGAARQRESLWSATRTAFIYTANSPALRAILVRVAAFILCAVITWAQFAIIARKQFGGPAQDGSAAYGILMAAMGVGAVIGVFCMPWMDRRFSTEGMVALCTACFGAALIALSQCTGSRANIWLAGGLAMVLGFNWVIVPTNFNIATQRSVPNWVKGRAIAMYMTVLFGSFAVGSPIWGKVASLVGISNATLIAGSLILLGLLLVRRFPLTRARGQDLSSAGQIQGPAGFAPGAGAVRQIVRYVVSRDEIESFRQLMNAEIRPMRRRNGAARWQLEVSRSSEGHVLAIETLTYRRWSDWTRAMARRTVADSLLEHHAASFCRSDFPVTADFENIQRPASGASPAQPLPWTPRPMIDWRPIVEHAAAALDGLWNRLIRSRHKS